MRIAVMGNDAFISGFNCLNGFAGLPPFIKYQAVDTANENT